MLSVARGKAHLAFPPPPAQLHRQGGHLPHLLDTVAGDSAAVAHLPPPSSTTGVDGYDNPLTPPSPAPWTRPPPFSPFLGAVPARCKNSAERRRRRRELTRPVSSPRAAFVSLRSVVVDYTATQRELDREPLQPAHLAVSPLCTGDLRHRDSPPSAAPKLPSGHRAPPGELLLRPQTPPLSFLHRGRPRHWSRGSPPWSSSTPWPGRAFGTLCVSVALHAIPVAERAHVWVSPCTELPPPSPPVCTAASARRRRPLRPSPSMPPPPIDSPSSPRSNAPPHTPSRGPRRAYGRRRPLCVSPAAPSTWHRCGTHVAHTWHPPCHCQWAPCGCAGQFDWSAR